MGEPFATTRITGAVRAKQLKVHHNKKSPQIVGGTKAADVLANFLPANINANPLRICVNLQILWLYNADQAKVWLLLLPFGRNLKRGF